MTSNNAKIVMHVTKVVFGALVSNGKTLKTVGSVLEKRSENAFVGVKIICI